MSVRVARIPMAAIALLLSFPSLGLASCASAGESPAPAISSQSNVDVGLSSEYGLTFGWQVVGRSNDLIGETFSRFEYRGGLIEMTSGRFVGLSVAFADEDVGRRTAIRISRLEVGDAPGAVGGSMPNPTWARLPETAPSIPGYQHVDATRLAFHVGGDDFIGIWRSENDRETILATFDDRGLTQGSYKIVGKLPFEAAVISVNGSHHLEQPTWIILASNPDSSGAFELVNLFWPQR